LDAELRLASGTAEVADGSAAWLVTIRPAVAHRKINVVFMIVSYRYSLCPLRSSLHLITQQPLIRRLFDGELSFAVDVLNFG